MKPTPIYMYKHLSCAAFKIKLTTGSGNTGMYEKLHDRNQDPIPAKSWCVCVCVCVQAPLSFFIGI
jgi:6-phosphogluconolactonase/glucosamine-6-phosphate isomerase/deaminase